MTLETRPVSTHLTDYPQIKRMYHSLFPKNEQEKWSWLMYKSWSKHVDFLAYYDGRRCIGFSYVIHQKQLDFLYYLAVDPEQHSHGYGGLIIEWLKQESANKQLVLDVEPLDDTASNAEQRRRRMMFYQRYGFKNTSQKIVEKGGTLDLLSTKSTVNHQDIKKMQRWFKRPF